MNLFGCNYLNMVTKDFCCFAVSKIVNQFMTMLLWYIKYETLVFFFFFHLFDLSPHFTIYCWILRSDFDKFFPFSFFSFLKRIDDSYVSYLVLCNRSEQLLLYIELKMPSDVFFFIVTRSWNMFWNGKIHVSK